MIKQICDRCGKEIDNTLDGLTNAVFPMYMITVQEAPLVFPRSVDLCVHCMGIIGNSLRILLQKEADNGTSDTPC